MSAPDGAGAEPSLEDLRATLEAVGECARPLTVLDPAELAAQAGAAYARARRHATRATADHGRAGNAAALAAALAAAHNALPARSAVQVPDVQHDDDDEAAAAYRCAAAYAVAAGCVLATRDDHERKLTDKLVSRLTLAIAELAAQRAHGRAEQHA